MKNKLKGYKWLLMNIQDLENQIETIEADIEKHKKRDIPKALIKAMENIDNEKLNKLLKKISKKDNSKKTVDMLITTRDNIIDLLLEDYKKAEEIESFIEKLEPKESKLIRLKYQTGLNWSEVAQNLDYSESHVKRLHKKILKE